MTSRLSQRLLLPLALLLAAGPAGAQAVPPTGNVPAASSAPVPLPDVAPPAQPAPPSQPAPPAVAAPTAGGDLPAPSPPTGSAGSPVPVPTDLPPPEVPLPSPIPLGRGFLFSGAVDGRYRTATTGRTDNLWLNEAELVLDHPFTRDAQPIGNAHVQVIAENPPDITGAQAVQVGEAYLLYRLPFQTETDSTAYLKVGQFQLPFGLLAVYDPHLLLQQPLYAQSLGLRTDFGAAVSGRFYGYLNYDLSITAGTGPNHIDADPNRVIVFRLGRTFETRNGAVNVGGSLLQGRLPITDLDAAHPDANELPPTGYVQSGRGFTSKTRIAGDGTITYKNVTGRGEAMIGADQSRRVLGYYAEGDFRFSAHASVVAALADFEYPLSNSLSRRASAGLTYAPDARLTLRALYEDLYDVPVGAPGRTRHRFTLQALLRF